MPKYLILTLLTACPLWAQGFTPAEASTFAWGCNGPEKFGKGLRIIKAREPGSDVVFIRTQTGSPALKLTSAGPLTEVTIPDIGRNGEDGIMTKRVYKDRSGRRWIYSNLDAHPTFKLYEESTVFISCYP